jgi:NADPH:quinone reductase
MRAAVCRELGPPSALIIEECDDPVAGPGQVTVDVEASGVNYVDALFIAGKYQIKPALPFIPGSEIAGTIAELGPGVSGWSIGDRVLASIGLGGFATKAAVGVDSITLLPDALDAPRAATFTQSYCTALFALRHRASIAGGETVLVLGGGGGVGLAAIDVTVALGGKAIAAASTESKRTAALAAGASAVIDTTSESIKDRARELADGTGVDLVIDPVGGELAEPALRALGNGGRYLVIGFAAGPIPSLPLNQVLLRNRTVLGVDWGAWAMGHLDEQRQLLTDLLDMVEAGRLHPVAPAQFPLDQASDALDALLGRTVVGKVALVSS